MGVTKVFTSRAADEAVKWERERIDKILLVRGVFRMGNAILAAPAIELLAKNFPHAQIDFVGAPIANRLFQNLSLGNFYEISRSFPKVSWSYFTLIKKLRAQRYDLAIDVSGSSAAMGSFIVGFSGARWRAGLRGKWDRWFNRRANRPKANNKYANLPLVLAELGFKTEPCFPVLALTDQERERAGERIRNMLPKESGPVVGIFVGGRKARGKRWAQENFAEIARGMNNNGARTVIFVGPEERALTGYFETALERHVAVVFESDVRKFAALVAQCDLFVACDSGPMHLACALGVRTVAIFLKNDMARWAPPTELAQVLYRETGATPQDVLASCATELARLAARSSVSAITTLSFLSSYALSLMDCL
jgi:heptosyltransferase III